MNNYLDNHVTGTNHAVSQLPPGFRSFLASRQISVKLCAMVRCHDVKPVLIDPQFSIDNHWHQSFPEEKNPPLPKLASILFAPPFCYICKMSQDHKKKEVNEAFHVAEIREITTGSIPERTLSVQSNAIYHLASIKRLKITNTFNYYLYLSLSVIRGGYLLSHSHMCTRGSHDFLRIPTYAYLTEDNKASLSLPSSSRIPPSPGPPPKWMKSWEKLKIWIITGSNRIRGRFG